MFQTLFMYCVNNDLIIIRQKQTANYRLISMGMINSNNAKKQKLTVPITTKRLVTHITSFAFKGIE